MRSESSSFKWNSIYEVGHSSIDKGNRKLFGIIQKIEKCNNHYTLNSVVRELIEYIKHHFSTEEKLIRLLRYDKLTEHINSHQKIIDTLEKLYNSMEKLSFNQIIQVLQRFIEIYLIKHITIEDRQIQAFYENKA